MKYLLPKVPRFFKAGLHCHSNISDGEPTPEEMKKLYKDRGYQILSITDHNVIADHSSLNEEDFLMLTGVEYNVTDPLPWAENSIWQRTYHLNFFAKRPDNLWQPLLPVKDREKAQPYLDKADIQLMSREYSVENINAIIAEANKQGFLVCYNHPLWCMQSYPEYSQLKGLWAIEVYNTDCLQVNPRSGDCSQVYADFVNAGNNIMPLATDDAHFPPFVGHGWTMIGAEKLEYASVIAAMEKGDLYASTGPEIYALTLDNGTLHVECSDAKYIVVESSGRFAKYACAESADKLLQEADLDITYWLDKCAINDQQWICVKVYDADCHYATTRAYRAKELL